MKIRILGLLIFLFVVIASISIGGELSNFIHFPGIGFVIIVSGGLALMRYRKGDGKLSFIKNLKRYSILSGVIGCLIGLIQLGLHVSDPAKIPMGAAVAILTIFYGLMFYCITDIFTGQEHRTA